MTLMKPAGEVTLPLEVDIKRRVRLLCVHSTSIVCYGAIYHSPPLNLVIDSIFNGTATA